MEEKVASIEKRVVITMVRLFGVTMAEQLVSTHLQMAERLI